MSELANSSTLEQELVISRLAKQEKLRQVLAKIEFNDCHGGDGQFCADDTGMMDHATAGMASATVKRVTAPIPKAGIDDHVFHPGTAFSGVVLSPNLADRQGSMLASKIRLDGIEDVDVAPITRSRADFIGVDRDSAGLVVTKGGVALAAVIGDPDGKARIVPLDTNRQDYNIIKHAAIRMFSKESVNEFNPNHDPDNGQFTDGEDTVTLKGAMNKWDGIRKSGGGFQLQKSIYDDIVKLTGDNGIEFGDDTVDDGEFIVYGGKLSEPMIYVKMDGKDVRIDRGGGTDNKTFSQLVGIVKKNLKVEFNDCHLPSGDGAGQFCSGDDIGGIGDQLSSAVLSDQVFGLHDTAPKQTPSINTSLTYNDLQLRLVKLGADQANLSAEASEAVQNIKTEVHRGNLYVPANELSKTGLSQEEYARQAVAGPSMTSWFTPEQREEQQRMWDVIIKNNPETPQVKQYLKTEAAIKQFNQDLAGVYNQTGSFWRGTSTAEIDEYVRTKQIGGDKNEYNYVATTVDPKSTLMFMRGVVVEYDGESIRKNGGSQPVEYTARPILSGQSASFGNTGENIDKPMEISFAREKEVRVKELLPINTEDGIKIKQIYIHANYTDDATVAAYRDAGLPVKVIYNFGDITHG